MCYCADNISKLLNKIDNINGIVLESSRNAELWEGGSENSQPFSSGPDNRLLSTVCSLQIGSRVRATVNDINLVTEQEVLPRIGIFSAALIKVPMMLHRTLLIPIQPPGLGTTVSHIQG